MSTHNIGFYGEMENFIFLLSSNTHLTCCSISVIVDQGKSAGPGIVCGGGFGGQRSC